jgi:hypothetical protein
MKRSSFLPVTAHANTRADGTGDGSPRPLRRQRHSTAIPAHNLRVAHHQSQSCFIFQQEGAQVEPVGFECLNLYGYIPRGLPRSWFVLLRDTPLCPGYARE